LLLTFVTRGFAQGVPTFKNNKNFFVLHQRNAFELFFGKLRNKSGQEWCKKKLRTKSNHRFKNTKNKKWCKFLQLAPP
jgi:hypothetical protein